MTLRKSGSPTTIWLRGAVAALKFVLPIALGAAVCALVVWAGGQSPTAAVEALFSGALGSRLRLAETVSQTVPLVFTGLAVVVAFRAGFFNIGAEGQFLVGCIAATALGTRTGLGWPVLAVGGALAGAGMASVAGWLKLARGAPEIITTIMLNYVALAFVTFSLVMPTGAGESGGWLLQADKSLPQSDVLSPGAQIPLLVQGTTLHAGLLVALAAAAGCWWLLFHTSRGLIWRASGESPRAARVAGISATGNAYAVIALSGALAGLGGAIETSGVTHQLNVGGFGYGYTAIAVALLADLNPLLVVPAAAVFAILQAGGGAMELNAHVPAVACDVVLGVAIFLLSILPRVRQRLPV